MMSTGWSFTESKDRPLFQLLFIALSVRQLQQTAGPLALYERKTLNALNIRKEHFKCTEATTSCLPIPFINQPSEWLNSILLQELYTTRVLYYISHHPEYSLLFWGGYGPWSHVTQHAELPMDPKIWQLGTSGCINCCTTHPAMAFPNLQGILQARWHYCLSMGRPTSQLLITACVFYIKQ